MDFILMYAVSNIGSHIFIIILCVSFPIVEGMIISFLYLFCSHVYALFIFLSLILSFIDLSLHFMLCITLIDLLPCCI